MKLTGTEGTFELTILDYECSDSPYFIDRNYLIVSLRTNYQNQQCVRAASILATWEVELLVNWMRSVADEHELSTKLTFIEPALGFNNLTTKAGNYRFNIKLGADILPNWQHDRTPFWLPVEPDKRELQGAIRDLEQQLRRFPVRD